MSTEGTFVLTPSTVVDALHAELRDRMERGDLAPGEQVTEARFAADYGVARATARGAMERLLSEGLLERTQRRTLQVRRFDVDDLEDVYCVREGLETAAVRRLARGRALPPAAVQAQAELVGVAGGALTSDVSRRADVAFHRALVAGAGSPRLERLYAQVQTEVRMASRLFVAASPGEVAAAVAEHQAVLDAIAAGEGSRAVSALVDHLDRSKVRVLSRLAVAG